MSAPDMSKLDTATVEMFARRAVMFPNTESGDVLAAAMTQMVLTLSPGELAAVCQGIAQAAASVTDHDREEEARRDAMDALEHDDSEWADNLRGYGQPDSLIRNDAGEYLGFM